jgi:hypothetical protein
MEVRVSIRPPATAAAQLPASERGYLATHILEDVPVFPNAGVYEVETGPNANASHENILWGDYFFVSVDMNGDTTANQFLATDEVGTINIDCFTGLDGLTPTDPCTNGSPNLSATGQGATGYTFWARYTSGEAIGGREPLATSWAGRYLTPGGSNGPQVQGGPIDLRIRAGEGGTVICQFFDIPADFDFECTMNSGQLALLAAGRIAVELTGGGPVRSVRMIPADLFVFADGFESGDTREWSVTQD